MGWAWCIIIQCPSSGVLGSTGWALQLVWSSRRRRRLRWERMVTSSLSMWISWRYRQPHHKYTVGMYLYVGVYIYIYICRNTQNINKQKHTEALTYNWDWNCSNWWPTSTRELLAATSLYTLYIFVFSMPLCPPSPNIFKVFADKFPYPGVLRGHLSRENIATPCKTKLPASSNLAVLKNWNT